jgi:hypothetical protein
MPSDERIEQALEAFEPPRAAFQSVIATTIGELDAMLAARTVGEGDAAQRTASELGRFASGHIDAQRFAALVAKKPGLDPVAAEAIGRARGVLTDIESREPADYCIRVVSGDDLVAKVAAAWADFGRVFGAARLVEAARQGQYRLPNHEPLMSSFPFPQWNRAERALTPPLIVDVDGDALQVDGLAKFLDGAAKVVLLVRGDSPPAPLARLVTPGVFVAQIGDSDALDRARETPGPAMVALVNDSAARFVHDPAKGPTLADRLSADYVPEDDPRVARGSISAFRQAEDLGHLRALVAMSEARALAPAAAVGGTNGDEAPAEPADRLAAWLLQQADIPTGETGS